MTRSTREFNDVTPEAIDHCVEFGAAKIAGYFNDDDLDYVREKGLPYSQENADTVSERFGRLWRIFGMSRLPALTIDITAVYAVDSPFNPGVHADSTARDGLSLLVPFRGPRAHFEVGESPASGRFPIYEVDYGMGDFMILSQYVRSVNGESVTRQQAYHQGVSFEPRFLYTIDLHARDVEIDFTQ